MAVWVPSLVTGSDDEVAGRTYVNLLDELTIICPFTEPVRFGLLTFPVRGPSRFFGGEDAVLAHVADTVARTVGAPGSLGVADGLFTSFAAARAGVVVPAGQSTAFRRGLPVRLLERRELATVCRRLGLHTVGSFADLAPARVAERFTRDALHVHRVARGEEGELRGQRDLRLPARVRALRGETDVVAAQGGFFGDHRDADRRAEVVAHRVRRRLGPQGIATATLCGGRTPQDRATLEPWPSTRPPDAGTREPWPGQIPSPAPATAFAHPVAVRVRDERDRSVVVDNRGLLSAPPHELHFDASAHRRVEWFAGPWLTVERWWLVGRRRAYLQLLTSHEAVLVFAERGDWWLAGIYD